MAVEQFSQGGSLTDLVTVLQSIAQNQGRILQTLQAIDAKLPSPQVGVPANSSSPGLTGQWSFDAGFFYICVAPSTWRRVAISSF